MTGTYEPTVTETSLRVFPLNPLKLSYVHIDIVTKKMLFLLSIYLCIYLFIQPTYFL